MKGFFQWENISHKILQVCPQYILPKVIKFLTHLWMICLYPGDTNIRKHFFVRLIPQASYKLVILLPVPWARTSSSHTSLWNPFMHTLHPLTASFKKCTNSKSLCQCMFSCLILSASTASQGWVAWVTTEYYFQGTRIKHNRSHQLKHELNIVLVSDVLLGFTQRQQHKTAPLSLQRSLWLSNDCMTEGKVLIVYLRFSQQCSWKLKSSGKLWLVNLVNSYQHFEKPECPSSSVTHFSSTTGP